VRVARFHFSAMGDAWPELTGCVNATGVVEFVGVKAATLHTAPLPEKKRLIECIGDSMPPACLRLIVAISCLETPLTRLWLCHELPHTMI
jgi:hypothetical protein